MHKFFLSSLIFLGLTLSAQATEQWTLFPKNPPAKDLGLALIAGSADLDTHDNSGDLSGIELSFDCQLLTSSEHTIRQQASLTRFHKNGFNMYNIEINPHYLYQIEEHTYFGIGPSLGLGKVEGDDVILTMGAGISLRKDITKKLFLDAELRQVFATNRDFSNLRFIGKVGYHFDFLKSFE